MTAAINLNVRDKRFAGVPVLAGIDFQVQPGEIVSLVGASGCGKSTLLRIIAGLDTAYDGEVAVLGKPVHTDLSAAGFVFQEPRLLPWLTVAQNVGFSLPDGGKDARVAQKLEEVGLSGAGPEWPKALSGGMAQRAAIARALVTQPPVLLMDEPFSAVDAFTRMRLQDLLLDIARTHGTTVLLVTHDISEAVYLSDRVLVLADRPGRLRGELTVDVARTRQRDDARLHRLEHQALGLLDEKVVEKA